MCNVNMKIFNRVFYEPLLHYKYENYNGIYRNDNCKPLFPYYILLTANANCTCLQKHLDICKRIYASKNFFCKKLLNTVQCLKIRGSAL